MSARLLAAAAALFALVGIACTSGRGATSGGKAMAAEPPFVIELRLDAGMKLQAALRNTTSAPQLYLHHPMLQPSELVLTDTTGRALTPDDERARRKYDTSVPRAYYQTLPAHGEVLLHEEAVVGNPAQGYTVEWAPFSYPSIPPGRYTARVRWRSERDDWREPGSTRGGRLKGIWMGAVESNGVELQLP